MQDRSHDEASQLGHIDLMDDERALHAAFRAKDARFDGRVFVGVKSTGIYCRPVCKYRAKLENCVFFASAAEAEKAGFRPCLACRPEIAPGKAPVDASSDLARRAAALIQEECSKHEGLEELASKLGYTDRHLRRVFQEEYDVTPSEYLQTCRLLLAKQLLTDTDLPVSSVALASGFGSVRRFNDVFKKKYKLTPTALRKRGKRSAGIEDAFVLRLGYREPYRFEKLLDFFRMRALQGVEVVDDASYARTVRLPFGDDVLEGWLRVEDDPAKRALKVTMSDSLLPTVSVIAQRIRWQFDTECDPYCIHEGISSMDEHAPGAAVLGTRLPGAFDGFETAVRAVLGQQVTVSAANKFAARIVESHGKPIRTPIEGLTHLFPTAQDFLAFDDIEESLGVLGVVRARSRSIKEIAGLVESGELELRPGCDVAGQMERLLAIKGIGPWTANYIAMRTMGHTDAFLETDAGVAHALPGSTPAERRELAESWRPWRSYAVVSLWNSLG